MNKMTQSDDNDKVVRIVKKNENRIYEIFIVDPPPSEGHSFDTLDFIIDCTFIVSMKAAHEHERQHNHKHILKHKVHFRWKVINSFSRDSIFPWQK